MVDLWRMIYDYRTASVVMMTSHTEMEQKVRQQLY